MKVVLVQLADEACEIAVFEMFWQDQLGKSLILFIQLREMTSMLSIQKLTSNTTKLSPSSPHRTTAEYVGSSSILC